MWTSAFVLAVALVPSVREMKPVDGMYSLRAAMPCPWYDWADYDTVGQCLAKANCVETRDASLPPEGYSYAGYFSMRAEGSGKMFTLGMPMRVCITRADINSGHIDLAAAEPAANGEL